ncbi:MAG: ABC transporter permease [Eubacterium sp.]|nr:ABC transporter permease [Eubacterium sp.]
MFGRICIAELKRLVRSKKYMFWTFAFPIMLGTLFYFAFSTIYNSQKSETIPVVIEVTDNAINEYKILQAFSNLDTDQMSSDLEEYYEDKAVAEAMGESFDKEVPISDESMDKIEDIESYDDMKKYDLADFPYDYLKVDRSEIDNISKDDLPFIKILNDLTYDDGNKMVEEVEGITYEEAEEMLSDGDIAGIITVDSMQDIYLLVNGNGVKHSILSTIISKYKLEAGKAIDTINDDHENLERSSEIMDESTESIEYIEAKSTAGDNKDPFVAYFYNLIAMIAIMGSTASLNVIVMSQANQSDVGIRVDMSPSIKIIHELAQLLAVVILQSIILIFTLTYLIFILGINFGGNITFIYLTTLLAGLVGDTLGFMIAHFGKISIDKKEAFLMAIFLGGGFMSGLMYGDMKVIIEQKAPWFNRINPSAVITDAFYALNVFGVGPRYYRALMYILITSGVMLLIGCILSRRSSYKSL